MLARIKRFFARMFDPAHEFRSSEFRPRLYEPLERWGGCPGMKPPDAIVQSISWIDWPENQAKLKAKGGTK